MNLVQYIACVSKKEKPKKKIASNIINIPFLPSHTIKSTNISFVIFVLRRILLHAIVTLFARHFAEVEMKMHVNLKLVKRNKTIICPSKCTMWLCFCFCVFVNVLFFIRIHRSVNVSAAL